ncbi:hypothetical protein BCSAG_41160 [Bacillus cereus]|uniref:Uncharacterized protein n=2 Tax=Bacillus thuringiensis TaxID=1428 RepID=A0A9X5NAV6_BACTU|nr:hypothetical protein IE1_05071 [Bacillus cereus BAG3O-2]EJQ33689.1 hypothetical protein IE7_00255 [Bacillus cereus BAG4O-1]KAA1804060.1 hypothetical protein FXB61_005158 [Bacillus cereus]OFC95532.1 hypothetical protein BTGOE4_03630 [Bacillus thuringiensis]CDN33748.1 unnamed protein product [Bacillus thuringiensis DB27]
MLLKGRRDLLPFSIIRLNIALKAISYLYFKEIKMKVFCIDQGEFLYEQIQELDL